MLASGQYICFFSLFSANEVGVFISDLFHVQTEDKGLFSHITVFIRCLKIGANISIFFKLRLSICEKLRVAKLQFSVSSVL